MKRYTYSLYDLRGNKTKTITRTSNEPVGAALETYLISDITPQFILHLSIMVEKIEEIDDDNQ